MASVRSSFRFSARAIVRAIWDTSSVRQAGPVMIALRSEKHLCFVFHPAKGFGVENPVPVSLVDGADVTLRFISVPSSEFRLCAA